MPSLGKQQSALKRFAEDEEMFDFVKAYICEVPRPKREMAEDIASFGARVDAYDNLVSDLRARFDNIRRLK